MDLIFFPLNKWNTLQPIKTLCVAYRSKMRRDPLLFFNYYFEHLVDILEGET